MIQYSGTITVDGYTFKLPKGYKAYFLRIKGYNWDMRKPSFITDRYGHECDFRVFDDGPHLVSARGVVPLNG